MARGLRLIRPLGRRSGRQPGRSWDTRQSLEPSRALRTGRALGPSGAAPATRSRPTLGTGGPTAALRSTGPTRAPSAARAGGPYRAPEGLQAAALIERRHDELHPALAGLRAGVGTGVDGAADYLDLMPGALAPEHGPDRQRQGEREEETGGNEQGARGANVHGVHRITMSPMRTATDEPATVRAKPTIAVRRLLTLSFSS